MREGLKSELLCGIVLKMARGERWGVEWYGLQHRSVYSWVRTMAVGKFILSVGYLIVLPALVVAFYQYPHDIPVLDTIPRGIAAGLLWGVVILLTVNSPNARPNSYTSAAAISERAQLEWQISEAEKEHKEELARCRVEKKQYGAGDFFSDAGKFLMAGAGVALALIGIDGDGLLGDVAHEAGNGLVEGAMGMEHFVPGYIIYKTQRVLELESEIPLLKQRWEDTFEHRFWSGFAWVLALASAGLTYAFRHQAMELSWLAEVWPFPM